MESSLKARPLLNEGRREALTIAEEARHFSHNTSLSRTYKTKTRELFLSFAKLGPPQFDSSSHFKIAISVSCLAFIEYSGLSFHQTNLAQGCSTQRLPSENWEPARYYNVIEKLTILTAFFNTTQQFSSKKKTA